MGFSFDAAQVVTLQVPPQWISLAEMLSHQPHGCISHPDFSKSPHSKKLLRESGQRCQKPVSLFQFCLFLCSDENFLECLRSSEVHNCMSWCIHFSQFHRKLLFSQQILWRRIETGCIHDLKNSARRVVARVVSD